MSAAKKLSPVRRLVLAMGRCALARREAQWMNGYRAAKGPSGDDAQLYAKEQRRWHHVEAMDLAFERLAKRVLSEARASARKERAS